jgi:hypothetical protein
LNSVSHHPSSYRDPSGFVFRHEGILYRQVNQSYKKDFDLFMQSGLYERLTSERLLIPHEEVDQNFSAADNYYKTLLPQQLPFISYAYEWSFDMLKDAALLTLQLAKEGIGYGMILKDATPFNVQFVNGKPIFIDTLSFEQYDATKPWIAYRQFCECFYAPLALMHYLQFPLQQLILSYPEGIPLSLAAKLLPWKSRLNLHVNLHIHLQAKYATKKDVQQKEKAIHLSKQKLLNILNSLENSILSFHLNKPTGVWSGYYHEAKQREDYVSEKKKIIEQWVSNLSLKSAIDVGANEGEFSQLLADKNIFTIGADGDHYSINNLYQRIKAEHISNIHPLIIDFSNPTPSIGVNNKERSSLSERLQVDLVMALAVIHHLCIGKNIPFTSAIEMFLGLGKHLIIEFVPKQDEKVQTMLRQKKDIYDWYTEENFIKTFSAHYNIVERKEVGTSGRKLFLMQPHESNN